MLLEALGHHVDVVADVPAQQRRHRRRTALVGHVLQVDAGGLAQHQAQEMRHRAIARGGVRRGGGIGLGLRILKIQLMQRRLQRLGDKHAAILAKVAGRIR